MTNSLTACFNNEVLDLIDFSLISCQRDLREFVDRIINQMNIRDTTRDNMVLMTVIFPMPSNFSDPERVAYLEYNLSADKPHSNSD